MKKILAGLMAITVAASGMSVVTYAEDYITLSGESVVGELYGTLDRKVEVGENKTITVGLAYSSLKDIKVTISGDKCVKLVKKSGVGKKKVKVKLKGLKTGKCEVKISNKKTGKSVTLNITVNSTEDNKEKYLNDVFELVNKEREAEGLNALALDETLCKAADVRAKELGTKFSHDRPDGSSCFTILKEYNIAYYHAGENIAQGQSNSSSVMDNWMSSTGHRENILNENYTRIGIGYDPDTNSWVQIFIED